MHDSCMATKTITLDLEAYELLRRRKKGRQSFSQVVKEHFESEPTVADFRRALDEMDEFLLSEKTLDAIEAEVERRGSDIARTVEF